MIERITYQCEYCEKRRMSNKTRMEHHEEKCYWNPLTRSCPTCIWYSEQHDPDEFYKCYLGRFDCTSDNPKPNIITHCEKWVDFVWLREANK